ncbi:MAG TPA: hypothetical protein VHX60_00070 [Acidobacteriaceae bacterium]|jgi:hypothetical protein|nr:hypothetical protein [Acidobacteriaceae bacterium]
MRSPLRVREPREAVLSLEVLAQSAAAESEEATQFGTLLRHFLERFFTNEMTSSDGEGKTRLVQAACAVGVPGLVIALYLYTPYHLPHRPRTYWESAGDHYFYALYSMVAMGLLTLFEWEMFFPDLLDVFVLSPLPVRDGRMFRARVAAILILVAGALFDANVLAVVVLPAAMDPPHLFRFLAAHVLAVGMSGIFGAAFFIALEEVLLGVLGDRVFRRLALGLQGISVAALLTMLFAYPVVAGVLQGMLQAGSAAVRWFPPFWFLGIYQRVLDGAGTPPVLVAAARMGYAATAIAVATACLAYPLAWWRKTRGLLEGAARREGRNLAEVPAHRLVHATLARKPGARAAWHFIGQNLLRVPRYRMVLVMYGGAGAALVLATVMRVVATRRGIHFVFSPDGLRAAIPIVAFWTVAGLRSTFLAPADQRGRWIFRAALGKAGWPQVQATQRWVLMGSLLLTLAVAGWACAAEPAPLHTWRFAAGQLVMAVGLSLLLTDAFFFKVRTIAFTGAQSRSATNPALLLIPYVGFFPAIVMFTVGLEPVIEASWTSVGVAAAMVAAAHAVLQGLHRRRTMEFLQQAEVDEDEEEFPMRLGLRY